VERTIDRASQASRDLGIGRTAPASSRNAARAWQADSNFQKYLIENRISVEHAPKGMSRQQTNHTRPTKSKRIVWTVEWVDQAGKRELQHDCMESESLEGIRRLFHAEKRNAVRRKANADGELANLQRPAKRKKTEAQNGAMQKSLNPDDASALHADASKARDDDHEKNDKQRVVDDSDQGNTVSIHQAPPGPLTEEGDETVNPDAQHHFYLHRPATASSAHILIPLSPSSTLSKCLRDRTVQEYPTIFILEQAPASLPHGYVMEEEYLRARKHEDAELSALDRSHGAEPGIAAMNDVIKEEPLDANSILDMLKRDVRA